MTVEGEVNVTKKRKGKAVDAVSKRCIFDCPHSVHGIDEENPEGGNVVYHQRISKKINEEMWATVEFGLTCFCAHSHFGKTKKWVHRAVDETLDEEFEEMTGGGQGDEEGEEDWD